MARLALLALVLALTAGASAASSRDPLGRRGRKLAGPGRRPPLSGAVVDRAPVGAGQNGAERVTLAAAGGGTEEAVFKAAATERHLRSRIRAGTYHLREVAVYRLAVAIGLGHLVPETVSRTIDGRVGSLQRLVPDLVSAALFDDGLLDLDRLGGIQILDEISGNDDRRYPDNLPVTRRSEARGDRVHLPWAIDNGLALPDGPPEVVVDDISRRMTATARARQREAIRAIDPRAVARALVAAGGIERGAVVHAVRRATRLVLRPESIAGGAAVLLDPTQGLSPARLAAIDRLVDLELRRHRRATAPSRGRRRRLAGQRQRAAAARAAAIEPVVPSPTD